MKSDILHGTRAFYCLPKKEPGNKMQRISSGLQLQPEIRTGGRNGSTEHPAVTGPPLRINTPVTEPHVNIQGTSSRQLTYHLSENTKSPKRWS